MVNSGIAEGLRALPDISLVAASERGQNFLSAPLEVDFGFE